MYSLYFFLLLFICVISYGSPTTLVRLVDSGAGSPHSHHTFCTPAVRGQGGGERSLTQDIAGAWRHRTEQNGGGWCGVYDGPG